MVEVSQKALKLKLACNIHPSAEFLAVKFHSRFLTILQVFQLKTGTLLIKKKEGCM